MNMDLIDIGWLAIWISLFAIGTYYLWTGCQAQKEMAIPLFLASIIGYQFWYYVTTRFPNENSCNGTMKSEKEIREAKEHLKLALAYMKDKKSLSEAMAGAKGTLLAFEWVLSDVKK